MGRRSIKENKNIYQQLREDCGLTREGAAELLEFISEDRIEKIESEKSPARPDEVLKMSKCYKRPELCNYYCTHECPIGEKYVPEAERKDLSQITLEMLAALNDLEKQKNRLIEITVDGVITDEERHDFDHIRQQLDDLASAVSSLRIWAEAAGNMGKPE